MTESVKKWDAPTLPLEHRYEKLAFNPENLQKSL
jgi:hypothetical protein